MPISLSALLLFDLSLGFDSDLACWLYVQDRFPKMCGFFLKSNVNVGSEICTGFVTALAHEFVCSESITWQKPVSITSGKKATLA